MAPAPIAASGVVAMREQTRPTLTVRRTLQTVGPAPPLLAQPDRPSALNGSQLGGRYRLEGLIADGATSWVYRGRHLLMDQVVAVKLLRPEFCASPGAVERFLDEARTLARLRHPNIVTVHDFDRTDARAWMVMELLEGETLAERRLRLGRLTWSSVRRIVLQLCSALRLAHGLGIHHRDIKPENCICLPGGTDRELIKIVDFGISSSREGDRVQLLEPRGCIAGTPAYMAPERMLGRGDERSDLYSIGVLMYELLTGTLPYVGVFPSQRKGVAEAPSVRARWCCSRAVDRVVLRAISYDPVDRFQSVQELADAIRRAGDVEASTVAVVRPQPRPALPARSFRITPPAVPVPSEAPRSRSIMQGLLSVTAALVLALGISPVASTIEDAYVAQPEPQNEARHVIRTLPLEHRWSGVELEQPYPPELGRFGSRPWRSDCWSMSGR